jgi:hypothetical protein
MTVIQISWLDPDPYPHLESAFGMPILDADPGDQNHADADPQHWLSVIWNCMKNGLDPQHCYKCSRARKTSVCPLIGWHAKEVIRYVLFLWPKKKSWGEFYLEIDHVGCSKIGKCYADFKIIINAVVTKYFQI